MNKTKIWKVDQDVLHEVRPGGLNFEERIHKWIENDLSIVLPNSILIGSKVKTDHGKELDLLAIDENGDLVILELKRGLTSREITAQVLDYASWVSTLTTSDIDGILQKQGEKRSIQELMSVEFDNGDDIDINENQVLYIVASEIDAVTERICRYLADNGTQINVATFSYFESGDGEFIARNVLVADKESPKDTIRKRSGRYTTRLFSEGSLDVGYRVKYMPADAKGIEVIAEIVKKGSKCLRVQGMDELFSFSGLRKKTIIDNELDLNAYYPYAQWGEWQLLDKGVLLSEL